MLRLKVESAGQEITRSTICWHSNFMRTVGHPQYFLFKMKFTLYYLWIWVDGPRPLTSGKMLKWQDICQLAQLLLGTLEKSKAKKNSDNYRLPLTINAWHNGEQEGAGRRWSLQGGLSSLEMTNQSFRETGNGVRPFVAQWERSCHLPWWSTWHRRA